MLNLFIYIIRCLQLCVKNMCFFPASDILSMCIQKGGPKSQQWMNGIKPAITFEDKNGTNAGIRRANKNSVEFPRSRKLSCTGYRRTGATCDGRMASGRSGPSSLFLHSLTFQFCKQLHRLKIFRFIFSQVNRVNLNLS